MKILHLCISDNSGGASKACYRLHRSLIDQGVNSEMLVGLKLLDDHTVIPTYSFFPKIRNALRTRIDKLPLLFTSHGHWEYASFNFLPNLVLKRKIKKLRPDILHLHWIGDGFFPIQYFSSFSIPIVATMHSRWLFNGAQHLHDDSSKRFVEGFNKKNRDIQDGGLDVDRWTWLRKRKHLENVSLNLVALSNWMKRDLKSSYLFKEQPIHYIPNGIDTDFFKPKNKPKTYDKLGLKRDRVYILFGANFIYSDRNKGLTVFIRSLSQIKHVLPHNVELIIFGEEPPSDFSSPIRTHHIGKISDPHLLVDYYTVADLFVLASKQDNQPTTVMEAMSCETSVVSFNVGGLSDILDDGIHGKLVCSDYPDRLGQAVLDVLGISIEKRREIELSCRDKILTDFCMTRQAKKMKDLYHEIISKV